MSNSRIPLINGNEVAAITDERQHLNWKAGQRRAAKRSVNRRARRQIKVELRFSV